MLPTVWMRTGQFLAFADADHTLFDSHDSTVTCAIRTLFDSHVRPPDLADTRYPTAPGRRRIDAAVEAFDPTRPETLTELREAVQDRVRFKRDRWEPPEAALVATKDALISALGRRSLPLDRQIVRAIIEDTIRWFVATYYDEGTAGSPTTAASSPPAPRE